MKKKRKKKLISCEKEHKFCSCSSKKLKAVVFNVMDTIWVEKTLATLCL
jgi:hypothetical protein